MEQRIALAYSGGFHTTVAIPWLREHLNAEVVAVTLDMGRGKELEEVRDRALAAGAARAHVLDVREEFACDYLLRALKADAMSDNHGRFEALAHPLIARKVVDIARIEHAVAIAHGGVGGAGERLDAGIRAVDPAVRVIAVRGDWAMADPELLEYAQARGIPLHGDYHAPHSKSHAAAVTNVQPAYVDIAFERGMPIAINGVEMTLLDLVACLTTIAGAHAVGRLESGGASAATLLHHAHKALQKLVTSKETDRFSRTVSAAYADSIENGLWFSPLREALDAFVEKVQERVTGVIRMKIWKGDCRIVRRQGSAGPTPDDRLSANDYPLVRAV